MDRRTFDHLVDLIKNHPVFHNSSFREQASPRRQLLCLLLRLAKDGSGASIAELSLKLGIGSGTVTLYIK